MPDPLELITNRGHTLRLSVLSSDDQRALRYELRFRNERTGEEWAEEVYSEKACEIVEWFGYPREPPPERTQLEEMRASLSATAQKLDETLSELRRMRVERDHVRKEVRVLVESLTDAWWLHAAEAYDHLNQWVEDQ